ncbi:hypothetical protein RF11_00759 [Thelohanellus kitauei]|uniref:Uncharacterized protein n=1 Tax=Thelohanellus kitauei TaxID=669202 RepID=A0A0C2IZA6_THEKT|nr:hypothetical protein RF11_00759 [Thelohanellus kitauei]
MDTITKDRKALREKILELKDDICGAVKRLISNDGNNHIYRKFYLGYINETSIEIIHILSEDQNFLINIEPRPVFNYPGDGLSPECRRCRSVACKTVNIKCLLALARQTKPQKPLRILIACLPHQGTFTASMILQSRLIDTLVFTTLNTHELKKLKAKGCLGWLFSADTTNAKIRNRSLDSGSLY